jgi:hypothetical protein
MKHLVPALRIAFLLAALGGPALAGEEPAPGGAGVPAAEAGDERDVPEPRLPGVEALPPGVEPEAWTSWYAGQDIDRTPRIDINVSAGIGGFAPTRAGSGTDAPSHDDISGIDIASLMRIGYRLSPGLGLGVLTLYIERHNDKYDMSEPMGGTTYEFGGSPVLGAFLTLRATLPFAHLDGRLLRFSRTEAPTGFALHLHAGLGFAMIDQTRISWFGSPTLGDGESIYFSKTENPAFLAGLGLEYTWVNFGFFVDFIVVNLGTPEPSSDPLWAESSVAEPLVAMLGSVGFSVHF